jgi:hypothetical protein
LASKGGNDVYKATCVFITLFNSSVDIKTADLSIYSYISKFKLQTFIILCIFTIISIHV